MHEKIQSLKHELMRSLQLQAEPFGPASDSVAWHMIEEYINRGEVTNKEKKARHCTKEFLKAFRAIERYVPQLPRDDSKKTYLKFLEHRKTNPEFYEYMKEFIDYAVQRGLRNLPLIVVAGRVQWEIAVERRDAKGRSLSVNILTHYGHYWTMDNPQSPFHFITKSSPGCRRLRHFANLEQE